MRSGQRNRGGKEQGKGREWKREERKEEQGPEPGRWRNAEPRKRDPKQGERLAPCSRWHAASPGPWQAPTPAAHTLVKDARHQHAVTCTHGRWDSMWERETLPFASTRTDLDGIVPSERSQTENDKRCAMSLTRGI